MYYIIYKITNLINGRCYVGITSESVNTRFNKHKRKARFGSETNLHKAMRKYGEENFEIEVILSFFSENKKEAYAVEQEYINKYKGEWHLYNMDCPWNIVDRSGKNNPMYGKISGNAKKISVNGVIYNSATEAAEKLNLNRKTLCSWAKNPKEKYNFVFYIK